MPSARVNGIDLYFEQSGEGRRLLFFNGSGATLESTGPMIAPYRDRFEVLVHDRRGNHDVTDRLSRITCPTLVAAGRYDGIAPLTNSEAIVQRIPRSQLRVYEGGHLFLVQDQRAVPEVIDFLDGA